MNYHGRLDSIGLAGFSHDFGALEGKHSSVNDVFGTFSASPRSSALNKGLFLLAEFFPFLIRMPTPRNRLSKKLGDTIEDISNVLLARTRKEMEMGAAKGKEEKSIIGLLSTSRILISDTTYTLFYLQRKKTVKGANGESTFHATKEEMMAQVNAFHCTTQIIPKPCFADQSTAPGRV